MNNRNDREKRPEKAGTSPLLVEVQVQQPHLNCPACAWDREAACLRVTGLHQAETGLPADLATLQFEGQFNVPVLLPTAYSFAPGTCLRVRLPGALGKSSARELTETV
ncbi:MAG TPA: hypothetical protein VKV40_01940 [Ktedonobacteraceae bacterium]|nr:hypothetical protein [Ktedonobacteraceae bacterium]